MTSYHHLLLNNSPVKSSFDRVVVLHSAESNSGVWEGFCMCISIFRSVVCVWVC